MTGEQSHPEREPANGDRLPADGAQPTADGAQPTADGAQPTADGVQPTADGVQPTADGGWPVSGLRNPAAAVRGVGMGTLVLECIVLLLALQPIHILAPRTPGWTYAVVAALAAGCLAVAALLSRHWGWWVGIALQIAVVFAGVFQYALFVLGGVFLLIWLYILKVRREVARPAFPPADPKFRSS